MNLLQIAARHGGNGIGVLGIITFIIAIIVWILFIVLIVIVIMYLIRRLEPQRRAGYREDSLEIAKRRFAAGEISKEEFEELIKELRA